MRGYTADVRPWITVLVACTLVFALLVVGIHFSQVVQVDRSSELDVHHVLRRPWYGFFTDVTQLGSTVIRVPLIVLLCAILAWWRRRQDMAFLLASVAGSSLLQTVIKVVVNRSRPQLFHHVVSAGGSSFPSGHATDISALCFALAIIVWRMGRFRALIPILALIAVLVGLSRVVLGVHYPIDVVAGYALGCGWVALLVVANAAVQDAALYWRGRPVG